MSATSNLMIGYKASSEQFGPRELVDLGVRAEEVGLDNVMVCDHLQPWRHEAGHAPQRVGSARGARRAHRAGDARHSVLTPTSRYNPGLLAQQFATLALLNPGRVPLAVGSGEGLNEIAVGRREWPDFTRRCARLRESVRLMRELWHAERFTLEGDFYRAVDATVYDRPKAGRPSTSRPVVPRWRGMPVAWVTASSAPAARAWPCRRAPRQQAASPVTSAR